MNFCDSKKAILDIAQIMIFFNCIIIKILSTFNFVEPFFIFMIMFISGLTSTTIPMYLAECAPSHVRGRIVSTNIAMVAFGQFVANLVDWMFSPDKQNGWR